MKTVSPAANHLNWLVDELVKANLKIENLKDEVARLEKLTADPTPRPKRRRPKHLSVIAGGRID